MIQVKLKKLLAKPELCSLIKNLSLALNTSFLITDEQGNMVLGEFNGVFPCHYPITLNEQILGQIHGEETAQIIAQMLTHAAYQEFEKKSLAIETLEKYEEINFLSDISHKLSICLTLQEIMDVVVEETNKLLKNDNISFKFLNQRGELEVFSYQGKICYKSQGTISSISGHVLRSGKAEIVNNVSEDSRYIADDPNTKSLICAPLKVQNQTIGVIKVSHVQPTNYTSEELKLFTSLTSQAAAAIQTAQYYEKLKEYSQTLEEKVIQRTQELEQAKKELEYLANVDELTQVYNRRYFNEYLLREWKILARERKFISLILGDVDYFKLYNDCYFHQAGDKCLQKVTKLMKQLVKRPADLVARFGGEEFVIILSNTNSLGAEKVAQQLCLGVENLKIPHCCSQCSPYVTLSLGVATTIPTAHVSPEKLIKAADQALYQAKATGRNRYCLYEFRPQTL
ncbi:diguanylate cyclase [Crocosphaera sp. UHCC 0190]|uniref:sensor domain-containing diguanylate cyclase n=1 Tax=Crocosphaera sp. UHCC 0190 TaxID=3110246 RepID=UPI002B1F2F7B|nr:diguanylate cyclase [Crocosphaera sp. UHCC 0190]MEA5509128.1 diguanylate cyclase [Crocosphaera sp. UHCC 0190]